MKPIGQAVTRRNQASRAASAPGPESARRLIPPGGLRPPARRGGFGTGLLATIMTAVVVLVLSNAGWRNCFAQEQRSPSTRNPVRTDDSERILVLTNGGVMRGRIRTVSTGWLVTAKNGYVVVPFRQVRFDADSVEDAWLRMRLQVENPTVASHLSIARWCLSQRLEKGAIRELREALVLDPSNETARLMLSRVDDERRRQAIAAQERSGQTRAFVSVETAQQPDDALSLAGLSKETAQRFVSQIQPLLLNRCGNARCHGSVATKSSFRLEHIRGTGNHRRRIERNLGAVLKRLDLGRPMQSELLKIGHGVHGGQTVFNGRAGAQQFKSIREWAMTAAAELRPANLAVAAGPVPGPGASDWGELSVRGRQPASRPAPARLPTTFDLYAPSPSSEEDLREAAARLPVPLPAARPVPPAVAAPSDTAAQATRGGELSNFQRLLRESTPTRDAFDPEAFNRKYAR